MRFVLYITPVPKQRPRFNRFTRQIYTPTETLEFETEVREQVCAILGPYCHYPFYSADQLLCVDIDFIFPRIKREMLRSYPEGLMWCGKKPDKDNLEKTVYDALNRVLWADDKQIVDGRTRKLITEKKGKARICINVYPAGDPPIGTCDYPNADILDRMGGRKEPNKNQ